MKILMIDCTMDRDSWGSEDYRNLMRTVPGAEVTVRRAPEKDLPSDSTHWDRIMISGSRASCMEKSEWVEELVSFLKAKIDRSVPTLGVCFGHQILQRALGGVDILGNAQVPEYGWTEIVRDENSKILSGLPKKFFSLSSHLEEVRDLAPRTKAIARSQHCVIQGFEHLDKPIYGVQFHPEKDLNAAQKTLESLKKKGREKWFQNANKGKSLYKAEIGAAIFKNFIANE